MFIQINGCQHFVEVVGPERGPGILTFHGGGGMGDSRGKKAAFAPLTDRYRVVAFDARGCGRSEEAGEPSFAQWTADAETLRLKLGMEKVIVAGGSSGGFLALEYALRYPSSVAALVLRGTAATIPDLEILRQRVRDAGITVDWGRFNRYWTGTCHDEADMKQALWEFLPLYPGKSGWNEEEGHKRLEGIYFRCQTHNFTVRHNWDGWDLRDRLGEIQVPTLITQGALDWVIPVALAQELACGIRGSRLELFAQSGHSPQLEENDRFVAVVRQFLAANDL